MRDYKLFAFNFGVGQDKLVVAQMTKHLDLLVIALFIDLKVVKISDLNVHFFLGCVLCHSRGLGFGLVFVRLFRVLVIVQLFVVSLFAVVVAKQQNVT